MVLYEKLFSLLGQSKDSAEWASVREQLGKPTKTLAVGPYWLCPYDNLGFEILFNEELDLFCGLFFHFNPVARVFGEAVYKGIAHYDKRDDVERKLGQSPYFRQDSTTCTSKDRCVGYWEKYKDGSFDLTCVFR